MSFKRDGDDGSWLNTLRKRRINELLAVDIPDDEGLLMSNGRYACLVCSHRPVFDTINMLAIHRDGKKHKFNAEGFYHKKQELADLVQKRNHERVCAGQAGNLKVPTNKPLGARCLLSAPQYDSRGKKTAKKPYDRKPVLDLTSPTATEEHSLPGNQHSTLANQHSSKNTRYDSSKDSRYDSFKDSRYNSSKDSRNVSSKDSYDSSSDTSSSKLPQTISEYIKSKRRIALVAQREQQSIQPYQRKGYENFSSHQATGQISTPLVPANTTQSFNVARTSHALDVSHALDKVAPTHKTAGQIAQPLKSNKELAEKYMRLREAGWKKDLQGNWIRDEEVEFDSDEEPPDLP